MFRTILFLLIAISASAQTPAPSLPLQRTVHTQTLTSTATPRVELTFDPAFHYIGGVRFPLYGVAEAELHLFVDADANKNVKRLYWVQFEGYLPNNQHTYDYSSDPTIEAAGWRWHTNAKIRPAATNWKPDSDGGQMISLLQSNGNRLDGDFARLRLVHLTDDSNRNELMIIYMEPSAGPIDSASLQKRALEAMKIAH